MLQRFMVVLVVMTFCCTEKGAAAESREVRLDASGLERDARLVNLRLDRDRGGIMLDDSELVEDDAPATGVPEGYGYSGMEWKEGLKRGVVIKKILMLEDPAADSGRLLFKGFEVKGNSTPLRLSLNGVEFLRPPTRLAYPHARQYIDYSPTDRWFVIDLPVGALRKGENEILMWADSDSLSWCVLIALDQEFARGSLTRTRHPNRSLKSSDGGRTWSDSRLGSTDAVDGEYSIRLSLDRHVPSGEYVSPVMDMADDDSPLKRAVNITRTRFTFGIDTPESTNAAIFTRFGSSPRLEDPSWTDWAPLGAEGEFAGLGNRRYFQWKAALATKTPLASPVIRSFSLAVEWEDRSPNRDLGVGVSVVRNGYVARGSYPFQYEDLLHPGLEKFRRDARLDKVVEGATSEFEVMMRLLNWAYRIPVTSNQYSWNWNDVVKLEKGEKGMPRLQMDYKGRRRDAMCLYSNQALIGAFLAMGFQARHINIHSEGVSGHEVTEVWSNELNKWFYLDATRDYYYFDPESGTPLNLLEVHDRMTPYVPGVETWQRPFAPEMAPQVSAQVPIGMREGTNPFSIAKDGRHIIEIIGHFRIIPRNDFLSNPLPVPVHTGATMWGWDGFLNYYDDKFPKRWEYQRYSNRALDFYEPLNQAAVYLNETAERGVLKIEINTFTPGFDTFLVRFNEGEWMEQKEPGLLWTLRSGRNRIEARVRNVRGILGPVSTLNVMCNP